MFKIMLVWNITRRCLVNFQCSRTNCCLHLQGTITDSKNTTCEVEQVKDSEVHP